MNMVLGYVRVSTRGQALDGYSIEVQRDEIKRYCSNQGWHLIDIIADEGVSGATTEREGLQDLLSIIESHPVQYVVVTTTSRLWRSDIARILIQKDFKRCNIDIKAVDRPDYSIHTKDPNEYLVNGIIELLDSYERMEIALKLKRGRRKKAQLGGYSGGLAPFGYVATKGSGAMTINVTEALAVRRVFELKCMCPWYTLQAIADSLNEDGYADSCGRTFNLMLVKRILDREGFYRGVYRYGDIESVGQHEAIL